MSEGFNDAAKTVMVHKIAGAVDEYLTPFIESVIRQAKAEAWDEGESDGRWNEEHHSIIEYGAREPITNPYREQEDSNE